MWSYVCLWDIYNEKESIVMSHTYANEGGLQDLALRHIITSMYCCYIRLCLKCVTHIIKKNVQVICNAQFVKYISVKIYSGTVCETVYCKDILALWMKFQTSPKSFSENIVHYYMF
jgi:hypothetical protein